MIPPHFSDDAVAALEQAEHAFAAAVHEISTEPYKLRRTVAAWPYFAELQTIVTTHQRPPTTAMNRAFNVTLYDKLQAIPVLPLRTSDAWK